MVLLDLGAQQAPSWLAFAFALLMMVVLLLLWFSMRRHLKRADYPDTPADADAPRSPISPIS